MVRSFVIADERRYGTTEAQLKRFEHDLAAHDARTPASDAAA